MSQDLFKKYDVPAPRYTSYPTVPYWSDIPTRDDWLRELKKAAALPQASWSAYFHIPFCETLCTFCGCNTVITKDHKREEPYAKLIIDEWRLYMEQVPGLKRLPLRQLHLGGGTPTFLSGDNLKRMLEPILSDVTRAEHGFEASAEVDPRRTTKEHVRALYELGFRRLSMGVQDFNPEVQRLVNRIQPVDVTRGLTELAREMGYDSINYDLIYGLPKQDLESFRRTAEITIELRPDRIALYSFALVPWIKPAQRLFKDEDLPVGAEKRALYELARGLLLKAGYKEIGMDHFALPNDSLYKAQQSKTLHRNFMGYMDMRTEILLGLGVSSISETPTCFHQNEKVLTVYERLLGEKKIPTFRGHLLSSDDRFHREQILRLMTMFEVELKDDTQVRDIRETLAPMFEDGLLRLEGRTLYVNEAGKPFLRNACMAFDRRLRAKAPDTKVFSQSV
ncbi:MAG TPA: oxygen-independent coproporphyrinogen III oxidase [Bdellovibrionales bacterium]|nr:oxygen-independent coproporphyrinogen III oxidase [Bdellovibrionales bacterium]